MKILRKVHIGLLTALIALIGFVYLGAANWLASSAYPAGVPERVHYMNYAVMAFIFGLAGWASVWRREAYAQDFTKLITGRPAVIFGAIAVAIFWGAALVLLALAFI